jgi:hypothetical protein
MFETIRKASSSPGEFYSRIYRVGHNNSNSQVNTSRVLVQIVWREQVTFYLPILHGRIRPYVHFPSQLLSALNARQEHQLFLNRRCQIQKHHDLRYGRPANVSKSGQVRLVVDDVPPSESATS